MNSKEDTALTTEEAGVVRQAIETEIKAFEKDIAKTGPRRDHFGLPQHDVRAAHLALCRSALGKINGR